jgi:hypothetical protein
MTTTASFADTAPTVIRPNRSAWHRFFEAVIEGRMRGPEDDIAGYLGRHRHDLPPQVWIELERRRSGS